MNEAIFEELQRYVHFGAAERALLQSFGARAERHFARIADEFYARIAEHPDAHRVFSGPEQIERLKQSLQGWLHSLFAGTVDRAYLERHARIGSVHVQIGLPQHYMFGAMNLVRCALARVIASEAPEPERAGLLESMHKLLDLELAIMLESYRGAYVDRVQQRERQERDDLQRRLALSEARYEEIVEKAEALITTLDSDGRVLLFNTKCERLTGLSREQAYGRRWLDLFVRESDRADVKARLARTLSRQPAAAYEGVIPVIESGNCRVRWHFTTLPGGAAPALCAIGIDVSNEHELGVRTRRAERLAALGTMAAGLAHEIRNPLNAAHLQLSLAERRLQRSNFDLEGAALAVQTADAEMQRLGALVQDFLLFARPQPLRLAELDLRGIVERVVALLAPEAASAGVALCLQPGEAAVLELDPERIKQVLLNLLRNAIEAAAPSGTVQLQLALESDSVELSVRDDGPGLPSEAPIFEPFFTTKPNGTGLGLAIVHRIVMDHGGQISARSVPGDTQFLVKLPRTRPS